MSIREMARQAKDTLLHRIKLQQAYRKVFDTPDGRVVLMHLMKVGKVTRPTFVPNNPHMTSFNEGQRHLALSVLKFINVNQDEIIKQVERGLENDET